MLQREGSIIEFKATNQVTGEVNRFRTSGDELDSPLILRPEWFDHINVFCMYARHVGDFKAITEQSAAAFKKQLEIPEECEELGRHAVAIDAGTMNGDPIILCIGEIHDIAVRISTAEIDRGLSVSHAVKP